VADDVRNAILSAGRAAAEYGVIVLADRGTLDVPGTEALRSSLRTARTGPTPEPVPTPLADRMMAPGP
jgi:hypothetical protein